MTLLSIVLQILIKYLPIWIPPDIRISGLLCWMWGKNRWDSYQGVSGGLRFGFFWQLSAIYVFIWTMWVVVIEGNGSFKFCHWLIKIKKIHSSEFPLVKSSDLVDSGVFTGINARKEHNRSPQLYKFKKCFKMYAYRTFHTVTLDHSLSYSHQFKCYDKFTARNS